MPGLQRAIAFAPPRTPRFARAVAGLAVSLAAGARGNEPTWSAVAWASGWLGALGNRASRRLAAAELEALGHPATPAATLALARRSWSALATDAALARQADRLTTEWVRARVSVHGEVPQSG